ncbi:MAG: lysophospholipid acyltransferase family protein [Acidobacteriota bacterium]
MVRCGISSAAVIRWPGATASDSRCRWARNNAPRRGVTSAGLTVSRWVRDRVPDRWLDSASAVVADAYCTIPTRRRTTAEANAYWLTGALERSVRRRYARSVFRHLLRCNIDLLGLPGTGAQAILDRIDVFGFDALDQARQVGRGVLVVGCHLGNFELAAIGIAALGGPVSVLVESVNPERDAFLARYRTSTGLRLITVDAKAPREVLRALARNEVVIVAGDRALKSGHSSLVPFARGRRPMPDGPAWLALKARATIVTGYVVRTPEAARPYRGVFESLLSTDGLGAEPVGALTARIAMRLGAAVERYPDQWFVFDPEWQGTDPAEAL